MTKAFRTACEAGINCCNQHRTTVEFLEQLAQVAPEWSERVAELRSKLDHTQEVCEAGIHIMESMQQG